MKKLVITIVLMYSFILTGCMENVEMKLLQSFVGNNSEDLSYEITMKQDLLCLMMAYPKHIMNISKEKNGKVYLVMKSGQKILYDDKKQKTYEEKLANPDLQDMMEQIYPLSSINCLMDKGFDPGRIRVYPLLKEVYGQSKEKVQSELVSVKVGNKNYAFNKNNAAAANLKSAMTELSLMAKENQKLYSFLYPASGTFNYRYISGTNRLSPHSFGIAIDLKRDNNDYWKWASREQGEKRVESYPNEIVEVLENHNFIWGGKWGHFDILHFEYRPELLIKSRYFANNRSLEKYWYKGLKSLDDNVKKYAQIIDETLK